MRAAVLCIADSAMPARARTNRIKACSRFQQVLRPFFRASGTEPARAKQRKWPWSCHEGALGSTQRSQTKFAPLFREVTGDVGCRSQCNNRTSSKRKDTQRQREKSYAGMAMDVTKKTQKSRGYSRRCDMLRALARSSSLGYTERTYMDIISLFDTTPPVSFSMQLILSDRGI